MVLDFGDGFFLRHATEADDAAICRVCLATGDAGKDAGPREDDPDLLGSIYCLPYRVFEPDLAFVVDSSDGVCGYLFGTPDTMAFNARLEREWYPGLRQRLADPGPDKASWRGSDWARRLIHHPEPVDPHLVAAYPSHGHIDLLAGARGRGIGRTAMRLLMERLRGAGSDGMFLDVDPRNTGARHFYRKLGFSPLPDSGWSQAQRYMVRKLPQVNAVI